jgi:hypothetical protein
VYDLTIEDVADSSEVMHYFNENEFEFDGYSEKTDYIDYLIQNEGYELFKWSVIKKYGYD